MLAEWMLSVARKAMEVGAPVRDTAKFDTANGPSEYDVAGMPFGGDTGGVDYVLCTVKRSDAVT